MTPPRISGHSLPRERFQSGCRETIQACEAHYSTCRVGTSHSGYPSAGPRRWGFWIWWSLGRPRCSGSMPMGGAALNTQGRVLWNDCLVMQKCQEQTHQPWWDCVEHSHKISQTHPWIPLKDYKDKRGRAKPPMTKLMAVSLLYKLLPFRDGKQSGDDKVNVVLERSCETFALMFPLLWCGIGFHGSRMGLCIAAWTWKPLGIWTEA